MMQLSTVWMFICCHGATRECVAAMQLKVVLFVIFERARLRRGVT
jgi:hypothetical protein